MIRYTLLMLSLILFPITANATCRFISVVDDVTLQESNMVLCADFINADSYSTRSASAAFMCAPGGNIMISISPGDFNFIGGDHSNLTIRGDAQDSAMSNRARVSNTGTSAISFVSASHAFIDAFLRSGDVFIRYSDYRNVNHSIQVSASGFTSAFNQLSCDTPTPAPTPAPAPSSPIPSKP